MDAATIGLVGALIGGAASLLGATVGAMLVRRYETQLNARVEMLARLRQVRRRFRLDMDPADLDQYREMLDELLELSVLAGRTEAAIAFELDDLQGNARGKFAQSRDTERQRQNPSHAEDLEREARQAFATFDRRGHDLFEHLVNDLTGRESILTRILDRLLR